MMFDAVSKAASYSIQSWLLQASQVRRICFRRWPVSFPGETGRGFHTARITFFREIMDSDYKGDWRIGNTPKRCRETFTLQPKTLEFEISVNFAERSVKVRAHFRNDFGFYVKVDAIIGYHSREF